MDLTNHRHLIYCGFSEHYFQLNILKRVPPKLTKNKIPVGLWQLSIAFVLILKIYLVRCLSLKKETWDSRHVKIRFLIIIKYSNAIKELTTYFTFSILDDLYHLKIADIESNSSILIIKKNKGMFSNPLISISRLTILFTTRTNIIKSTLE